MKKNSVNQEESQDKIRNIFKLEKENKGIKEKIIEVIKTLL